MDDDDERHRWVDFLARVVLGATPVVGGAGLVIYEEIRARQAEKVRQTFESIIEITGPTALAEALDRDPNVEAMFVNVVDASIRTGLQAKRNLLARAAAAAVLDDARFDESHLLADVLAQLDVPHVRTLKALADEWEEVQADPTKGSEWGTSKVWSATPAAIKAALVRTGTALPSTTTLLGAPRGSAPRRQTGISDYGLEVVALLVEEGYADARA